MEPLPPLLLLGTDEPVPQALTLRAGALEVRVRGTRLLALHAGGREVWHGASFLYRDTGWGTPEPVAERVTREDTAGGGFTLRIEGHIPAAARIDLTIEITGRADGSLRYEATATPRADLPASRIGLCLQHPPEAMGRRLQVTHTDGRTSDSTFPTLVPAWPPFMGVRALRHEYADGAWARCRFEGDAFELEDQRNNADASFKTYSRSNMMPRPFTLRAGVAVRQALELALESLPPPLPPALAPRLAPRGEPAPMPRLGLGIAPSDAAAAPALRQALRELAPGVLHLGLRSPREPVDWHGVAALLEAAGARLRLDVEGLDADGAPQDLRALAGALAAAGVEADAVAAFPSHPPQVAAARAAFPRARVGGGTPFFFVQLHRMEDLGPVDFLTFTTASIVHGADDDAVMHGLQCLPGLLRTLAASHPGVPVHTGPSAIAAPRSPLGPQPEGDGRHRVALARRDPRTGALFAAAWLLGHVASLAEAGAQAASVLALSGDQGLTEARPGEPAHRRPAFFVLQALAGAATWQPLAGTRPGELAALQVAGAAGETLLLANLTAGPCDVDLSSHPWAATGAPYVLDPRAVDAGDADPWRAQPARAGLRLGPWSVARIDPTPR